MRVLNLVCVEWMVWHPAYQRGSTPQLNESEKVGENGR